MYNVTTKTNKESNTVAFSQQVNYTAWATGTYGR
jgi:hypothetical protein